ncbi:peroxiredoxin [Ohtaekwangia koreensis]|uniref:thioredoxin-dependent peroxiredoxin n=1 Tax=Ohtaekwangia koreensis TaxID=688867 RepID=A0A1T5MC73_9BACT|nr:peroxiredoxin [Ohtaekwangia koreensis]SKC85836.1 peroxiredoxin Q/BCP [Ohtaekwangia koreensis]
MPLATGTKAPDFTLGSTSGRDFTLYKDMKNKPCVLYFYPKDFSVGCTNEACSFRDTFEVFKELNITIIGISRDTLESHAKFKKTLALPFDLLADNGGKVCELYDTQLPFVPMFTKRTTYLLDKDHTILAMYQNIFSSKKHIKAMVENVTAPAARKAL